MGSWQLTRHSAIASPPFPLLHTSVWAAAASRWGAEMDYCKKFAKYLQCSDCSRHLSWHVEQFDSVIWADIASCTPAHAMTSGWYRSRLRREVWRSAASQAILDPILALYISIVCLLRERRTRSWSLDRHNQMDTPTLHAFEAEKLQETFWFNDPEVFTTSQAVLTSLLHSHNAMDLWTYISGISLKYWRKSQ